MCVFEATCQTLGRRTEITIQRERERQSRKKHRQSFCSRTDGVDGRLRGKASQIVYNGDTTLVLL